MLLSNINFCLFRAFLIDHYLFLEMINVLNVLAQNHKHLNVLVRWDEVFYFFQMEETFLYCSICRLQKKKNTTKHIQSSIWYCEERRVLEFSVHRRRISALSLASVSYSSFRFGLDHILRNLWDVVFSHKMKRLVSHAWRVEKSILFTEHNLFFVILSQIHCMFFMNAVSVFFSLLFPC